MYKNIQGSIRCSCGYDVKKGHMDRHLIGKEHDKSIKKNERKQTLQEVLDLIDKKIDKKWEKQESKGGSCKWESTPTIEELEDLKKEIKKLEKGEA